MYPWPQGPHLLPLFFLFFVFERCRAATSPTKGADDGKTIHAGYVTKLGAVRKNWKLRWCIIRKDGERTTSGRRRRKKKRREEEEKKGEREEKRKKERRNLTVSRRSILVQASSTTTRS
jgi:hypothetical protein